MSPSIVDRLKHSSSDKQDTGSYFAFLHFAICTSCPHATRQRGPPSFVNTPSNHFIKAFRSRRSREYRKFNHKLTPHSSTPSSHVDIIPYFPQLVNSTTAKPAQLVVNSSCGQLRTSNSIDTCSEYRLKHLGVATHQSSVTTHFHQKQFATANHVSHRKHPLLVRPPRGHQVYHVRHSHDGDEPRHQYHPDHEKLSLR